MWEMGHKEFGRYYNYSKKKFSIETDELIVTGILNQNYTNKIKSKCN